MASLKDTLINGALRVIGTLFAGKVQTNTMHVPTSSGGSTYGAGTSGQVLATNGTTVYWKNDSNSDTKVTQTATTTNANYEVLFSATADNTTRTETTRKNSNLKFNPSTGNLQATQLNGVTIGSSPNFSDTTYSAMIGGYCNVASTVTTKIISSHNYEDLVAGSTIVTRLRNGNSIASALTANVNNTGNKALYINGKPSSSTNYSIPAGTYNMRYDGTNWHIRTDGYDATIPYESFTAKSLVKPFSTTTCSPNYFFTPGAITSAFAISMPSNNSAYTCEGYFDVPNTTFNLSETITFEDGSTAATIQWQGDSIVTAASYEFSVQLVTATTAIGYLNMIVQY